MIVYKIVYNTSNLTDMQILNTANINEGIKTTNNKRHRKKE